ncbi:MAG TPA: PAS domain S-box protein [Pyrinomonadaceae bacterium]
MVESGLKILLVYDNDESRRQLEEILRTSDIEEFRLESVPAYLIMQDGALNSIQDVCIIESVGCRAIQLIQGLKALLSCPIIVLSWDSGSEVLSALRAGATDCIIRNHLTPAVLEESIFSSIDQAQHRNALDQYERWYLSLVENSEDLIFTQDLSGTFSSINRMVERLTGYTQDEVIGMNIKQLVAPEYQELMRERYQQMLADHRPCSRELVIVSKHWQRIQVQMSSHLVYKHGSPVGIQGTMRVHHNVVSLRATG